jgi:hypothetical protein
MIRAQLRGVVGMAEPKVHSVEVLIPVIKPSDQPQPVLTEEEIRTSFSGPAVHSNKMLLTMTPAGARLTFMEHSTDVAAQFRSAVLLSIHDAIALKNLLERQLKPFEEMLKSEEAGESKNAD